jgi:single-strand DNA-binding protein
MAGISKVILVGNLGRDPETRYTPSGTMNVQFTMAVTRRWNDQGGQLQERTTWFRVTAWAKLAERLDTLTQRGFLAKGRQVYVSGSLDAREYQDQQGQTRTSLDVRLEEFEMLGNRGEGDGNSEGFGNPGGSGSTGPRGGGRSGGDPGDDNNDMDDVPF